MLIMMINRTKLTGLTLVLLMLSACEQPAPQVESLAEPAPAELPATDAVTSIDAAGNVAPFGMASRQPVPVEPVPVANTATGAAAINDPSAATTAAATSAVFSVHCAACHGADAKGVQGLGLNLVESQLVATSSQAELAAFLKAGRAADSPDNVTKVPMPGFAWMGDDELNDLIGYLKSLQ
jgi:mono/diheme cytochrome c family protein